MSPSVYLHSGTLRIVLAGGVVVIVSLLPFFVITLGISPIPPTRLLSAPYSTILLLLMNTPVFHHRVFKRYDCIL